MKELNQMLETIKGKPAHDFTATDSTGRTIRLSDYAGKKHVVLVFNRGFR